MSSPDMQRQRTSAHGDAPPPPPPVATTPVVDDRVVAREQQAVQLPHGAAMPATSHQVSSFARITPARILTAAGGGVLLVIGLIALAKAGLSSPLDQPVVDVAGMTHTALLGIIGAAFGLVLLTSAVLGTDPGSRSSSIFFGALLGIGGVVAIATPESFKSLALESSYGWMSLIIGAIVVLANLLLPTITARKVTYR